MNMLYNWVIKPAQGLAKVVLKSAVSKGKGGLQNGQLNAGLPKFEVIGWRGIEVCFGSRLKGLENCFG